MQKGVEMKTQNVPLTRLHAHPRNARGKSEYDRCAVADLAASIRAHGVLQPLVVQSNAEGYEILAGHRRHAALRRLKVKEAPCVVLEPEDGEAGLAVLLTDNTQHKAVDPLREAEAVEQLVSGLSEDKHPHDRAATMLGKSVAWRSWGLHPSSQRH